MSGDGARGVTNGGDAVGDALAAFARALRRADEARELDDRQAAIDEALACVGVLGLELARAPARRWSAEVIEAIAASAPIVARNATFIAAHVDDTRRMVGLPFDGEDDWRRVCERRSAFELLRALYEGSAADATLGAIDVGEVDARLRFVGAREGQRGEGAPDDLPVTHWWWWLPGAAPDAADA